MINTVAMDRTQIIVQDDCTPEHDIRDLLRGPFTINRNAENIGFAGNCNAGAQFADGECICFLNQDIAAINTGWADYMLMVLATDESAGIVGPKLLFPNNSIQSAGGLFDGNKGPFHRYLGWADPDDRRINKLEKVSWLTGACIMMRTAEFHALGGFDEGYTGGYFEDVDLCMRVKHEIKKHIWYQPASHLYHDAGSTGGNKNFMKNSIRFHQKWDSQIVPDTHVVWVNY
jgi:GT2 family glycosyltransferase